MPTSSPEPIQDLPLLRRFIEAGGVELTMGALWLLASAVMTSAGAFMGIDLGIDVLAFLALILATRHRRLGAGLLATVLILSILTPPQTHGYVGVLSLIGVVTLLRAKETTVAIVHTAITVVVGTFLSWRSDFPADGVASFFAWMLSALLAWAIGLGFRAQSELAVVLERERLGRERMDFAWDLHDFVARDLTIISMRADAAIAKGGATVRELESIAEHSRAANKFLRETAKQFGDDAGLEGYRAMTIDTAIDAARKELTAAGRELQHLGACPEKSRMVQAVGGRVLFEALHNALKHGEGAVELECGRDDDEVVMEVRNRPAAKRVAGGSSGIGIPGMMQRAAMFEGSVTAGLVDGRWVCTIRLPLKNVPGKWGYARDSRGAV